MSAFVCMPEHIGLLAAVAVGPARAIDRTPAKVAALLARENIASVAYRYPDDTGNGDRPGPRLTDEQIVEAAELYAEHFSDNPPDMPASSILNMARCLEYQSCEHPGWETSAARAVLSRVEDWARRAWLRDDHRADKRPATVNWEFTLPDYEMLPASCARRPTGSIPAA